MPTTTKTKDDAASAPRKARAEAVLPIDLHIGAMIRAARAMRSLSRSELAQRIGVGAEAVEKYERGEARVLASRLWAIAEVLEVPVASFFEQFNPQNPALGAADLKAALTMGNMGIVLELQRLTYDQRAQIKNTIDAFQAQNEQRAAGAAG
jgi:transcriptional regulator with XRE-family HTH domain